MRRRYRKNPTDVDGLSTDTIVLLGIGTALLGAIVYAIYQIGETNDQISSATDAANAVGSKIGDAATSAQGVAQQIAAANATVTGVQASPAVQEANAVAQWWQDL
jgi:hypothetical protein